MDARKRLILETIIKEHIATGIPVASGVLVKKYNLEVSPATVRNEMSQLESGGYIVQPHTSAGRIPTVLAYKDYLANLKLRKINKKDQAGIDMSIKRVDELSLKKVAKKLADISGLAVFWAFHRHNLYYTGISNLLKQPEFSQIDMIYDISKIIDRMDEIIDSIFEQTKYGVKTIVGDENPFGEFMGATITKYKSAEQIGMFGILGPIRQRYEHNIPIAEYIYNNLNLSYDQKR